MGYTKVIRASRGADVIAYCEGNGKGHNGNEERNMTVTPINMIPNGRYAEQMKKYWDRAGKRHRIQTIHIVQSFSKNEFDPDKPEDIETANAVGVAFTKEHYPDRQSVVYTQMDGKSGLIHNHIIVSNVAMNDLRACDKNQYHHKQVKEWSDEVISCFTILDTGRQKNPDKISQTERAKRVDDDYVWKDDLRTRIHLAMDLAENENDFFDKLSENGVNGVKKYSKKHGEYITYELTDLTGAEKSGIKIRNPKVRSYKMGYSYSPEEIRQHIGEKKNQSHSKPTNAPEPVQNPHTTTFNPKDGKLVNEDGKSPKNDFNEFLHMIGESYFYFDGRNKLIADWRKYEMLRQKFEEYKNAPEETEKDSIEMIQTIPNNEETEAPEYINLEEPDFAEKISIELGAMLKRKKQVQTPIEKAETPDEESERQKQRLDKLASAMPWLSEQGSSDGGNTIEFEY